MNLSTASKKTKLISVLAALVIIAGCVSAYFYSKNKSVTQSDSMGSVEASAQNSKYAQLPDNAAVFGDLIGFAAPGANGEVAQADGSSSVVWFGQHFKAGADNAYVVFVATRPLDGVGGVAGCESCEANLSAVTYKHIAGMWQVVSSEVEIAHFDNWGETAQIKQAEILQLAPDNVAFMFETTDGKGGWFQSGKKLLAFSENSWHKLGDIELDGDNSGACDTEPVIAGEKSNEVCWSYKGKLSTIAGANAEYPDLLVTRKGTISHEHGGAVVPVENITYKYVGDNYCDTNADFC